MPWQDQNDFVRSGEEVRAGVTNRAPRINDANARYLKQRLDAAELGQLLLAPDETVESAASVGDVVYFDSGTDAFKRALAQTDTDLTTGTLVTASTAYVWGLIVAKTGTRADILLGGLTTADFTLQSGEELEAGVYYLSGIEPGALTRQQPGVSVPVLKSDGAGRILLWPQMIDFVDRHVHYRFALTVRPAGDTTPPAVDERHVITSADSSRMGWLPADDDSFDGHAPKGAAFGYNLAAHTALQRVWPPLPLQGAYLELDRGVAAEGGHGVPLGAHNQCIIDRYGIWWMSDCYDDVPWPTDLNTTVSDSFSESISSTPECPRLTNFLLTLWFSRPTFATDQNVVTRLSSKDARLTVRCEGTETEASVGPLELDLDLALTVGDDDATGYLVFKELDSDTETFNRGPVVSGIKALTDNVTLTPSATVSTYGVGQIGIAVTTDPSKELDVLLVRLDRVQEAAVFDTHYLEFPVGLASSYRGRVDVPADLLIATPRLRLRFWILGRTAGTLPALTLVGRVLPRPDGGPETVPDTDSAITLTYDEDVLANQYVEVTSAEIEIDAGDSFLFEISRADDDDYAGDVGILDHRGLMATAS